MYLNLMQSLPIGFVHLVYSPACGGKNTVHESDELATCVFLEGQGGVHHGTFKATCRREGEWREDFNELLADPLNRRIAIEWDRVLNQLLPDHVDTLLKRVVSETW